MFEIIFIIIVFMIIKKIKSGTKPAPRHTQPTISASIPKAPPISSKRTSVPPKKEEERTFIEPTKPYRPAVNSGERYEEWMAVPAGKRVVHCNYCGADNLISEKQAPHRCTCYFCREEL